MVCEGEKLLREALAAGITIKKLVCRETPEMPLPETQIIRVPKDIIASLSLMDSPPQFIFTVPIPDTRLEKLTKGTHIILDRIQDPGNLGSIIRTARAFGVSSVILTPGCADITNPKTLRASMGALFGQRIMCGETAEILEAIGDYKCYTTGTGENALRIDTVSLKDCAVVIGNEGAGVSEMWRGFEMLTIPIEFESLGAAAAAAIVMWESMV